MERKKLELLNKLDIIESDKKSAKKTNKFMPKSLRFFVYQMRKPFKYIFCRLPLNLAYKSQS
jgi:hypothetical protein